MKQPLDVLKEYWGYDSFRPLQEEIILSVLSGKDTLALLPTGGGKSICFQIPAMCLDGICVVISPLIALMKDQVEQLEKRNIKAAAIVSGMSKREVDVTLDNCIYGSYKFLYVSPERLKSDLFIERAKKMKLSMLAVDEAHCISQWGYDFRPPYLEIAAFKNLISTDRLIALTATATKEVKADIQEKLEMEDARVFQKSFARKNLSYSVFNLENKDQKLIEILRNVPGSSVVYVRNRKNTKAYAEFLRRNNISADYYHAGLSRKARSEKQDEWISNKVRVMVATNAFGMGIDKPDVRTVIHMDLPDTLEAYYQEAGRAGRDERNAFAIILYTNQDETNVKDRLERSFIDADTIKLTYQALCNFFQLAVGSQPTVSFPFDFNKFCGNYKLSVFPTFQALKKLEKEGVIQISDSFYEQSRVFFLLNKQDLYEYQVSQPRFDALLKTLLRLYGGEMFNSFVKVKETDISKLLNLSTDTIKKQLRYLNDQSVIDYQFSQGVENVTFLMPRMVLSSLPINEKEVQGRIELARKKVEALVKYLNTEKCRSLYLQHYFDEQSEIPCGVCDNDIALKKKKSKIPFKVVLEKIIVPKNLSQLRKELLAYSENSILETLRLLIEEGKVIEEKSVFRKKNI